MIESSTYEFSSIKGEKEERATEDFLLLQKGRREDQFDAESPCFEDLKIVEGWEEKSQGKHDSPGRKDLRQMFIPCNSRDLEHCSVCLLRSSFERHRGAALGNWLDGVQSGSSLTWHQKSTHRTLRSSASTSLATKVPASSPFGFLYQRDLFLRQLHVPIDFPVIDVVEGVGQKNVVEVRHSAVLCVSVHKTDKGTLRLPLVQDAVGESRIRHLERGSVVLLGVPHRRD